ncbi:MAG: hypothetical protein ABIQ16_19505, partial [Polyangiaceae bacterium]
MTDTWLIFAGFTLAVVVVAGFLRLAPLAPRHRLRRSVILLGFYAATLLLNTALRWAHAPEVTSVVHVAAELLQLLLVINLVAIGLFDLTLRAFRINYPDILHDIVVGAAYV